MSDGLAAIEAEARADLRAKVRALPVPKPMGHGFVKDVDPYEAYIEGVKRDRQAILALLSDDE